MSGEEKKKARPGGKQQRTATPALLPGLLEGTDGNLVFAIFALCLVILVLNSRVSAPDNGSQPLKKRTAAAAAAADRGSQLKLENGIASPGPTKELKTMAPWKAKLPCNVLADAPSENWEVQALRSDQRRASEWVCKRVKMMNGKKTLPRNNRDENNALKEWWLKDSQRGKEYFVQCWSKAVYEEKEDKLCTTSISVACPSTDWLLRAGIGNRYFFIAATVSLADRMNVPFVTPSPLGAAGATLPTLFDGATLMQPWEHGAADSTVHCDYGKCTVPGHKLDPKWGPDIFGQGEYTAAGLAKLRPVMCDMLSAPNTLGLENAPGRDDIVIHFRTEAAGWSDGFGVDKLKGFGGFTFLKQAIMDARDRHSGRNVVVVGMKPCFEGHPIVVRLKEEYGAKLRISSYPKGSNKALKDMQFLAMARILILSVSTFSYWAGYFSESAEALYFPISDQFTQFNPWCKLINGYESRPATKFVDSRTGDILGSAAEATERCHKYTLSSDKNSLEVKKLYGLPFKDLEPGGCWK